MKFSIYITLLTSSIPLLCKCFPIPSSDQLQLFGSGAGDEPDIVGTICTACTQSNQPNFQHRYTITLWNEPTGTSAVPSSPENHASTEAETPSWTAAEIPGSDNATTTHYRNPFQFLRAKTRAVLDWLTSDALGNVVKRSESKVMDAVEKASLRRSRVYRPIHDGVPERGSFWTTRVYRPGFENSPERGPLYKRFVVSFIPLSEAGQRELEAQGMLTIPEDEESEDAHAHFYQKLLEDFLEFTSNLWKTVTAKTETLRKPFLRWQTRNVPVLGSEEHPALIRRSTQTFHHNVAIGGIHPTASSGKHSSIFRQMLDYSSAEKQPSAVLPAGSCLFAGCSSSTPQKSDQVIKNATLISTDDIISKEDEKDKEPGAKLAASEMDPEEGPVIPTAYRNIDPTKRPKVPSIIRGPLMILPPPDSGTEQLRPWEKPYFRIAYQLEDLFEFFKDAPLAVDGKVYPGEGWKLVDEWRKKLQDGEFD